MSFLSDLGDRFVGKDEYTASITASNNAQSAYLLDLASGGDEKTDNSFLIAATIGTLVVAGVITYFVVRKK